MAGFTRFFLTSLLFLCSTFLCASNIDSLKQVLENTNEDSMRIELLCDLGRSYWYTDLDSTRYYGERALDLAHQQNNLYGKSSAWHVLGAMYLIKGDYDRSLDFFKKTLDIRLEHGWAEKAANAQNNIGLVYKKKGDYKKAINYYLKSLKIYDKYENRKGAAMVMNNIGVIYTTQGNTQKGLEYHKKAAKVYKKIDDAIGYGEQLSNIGVIYQNNEKYDSALIYLKQALTLFKEHQHKRNLAKIYNNIGSIQYYKKNYDRALAYHQKALELKRTYEDKISIASSLSNIGDVYYQKGVSRKALSYYDQAKQIINETNSMDNLKDLYKRYAQTYAQLNNFRKAFVYYKKYSSIKDSLFNHKTHQQIAEMEAKYQAAKKEKEIQLQKKELAMKNFQLKKNKFIICTITIGFVIILLLSGLIFYAYRQKRKANNLLTKQNKAIEYKNKVIENKNKNITDSITYAKRIQNAILPTEKSIQKVFSESFILYLPRDIVSGDFYWFNTIKISGNTSHIIAAVDCTGHGVPGAFMSMIGNDLLNHTILDKKISNPAKILTELNKGVVHELKQREEDQDAEDGMDMAVCKIEKSRKKLTFSGALRPLLLARNNKIKEIKGAPYPIGSYYGGQKSFKNHQLTLQKNDKIYLYSDGYPDQFGGEKGKKLTSKHFKRLLLENHKLSMAAQKEKLMGFLKDWKHGEEQLDDILVIGLKV